MKEIFRLNLTKLSFLVIVLSFHFCSFSQSKICDTIFREVDKDAAYGDNSSELSNYLQKQLFPILNSNCISETEILKPLIIKLIIDKNGKIIDVEFPKSELPSNCKEELKKQLLTMTGWKPATKNNKNVCSIFIFPIRICLQ